MSSKWKIYLGCAAVVFGLGFSQVLPSQLQAQSNLDPQNQSLVETIKKMEREISDTEAELASLREEIHQLQSGESGGRKVSSNLQLDIQLQQAAAGLTELTAEGIIITLDDNSTGASAAKLKDLANYRPNDYIIHDKNLLYLVNELKEAKSQGIAINDQRVAASSDIRCVGTVIMINSTRVAPPFEILAVGNTKKLKKAIEAGREYHYLKENKFPVEIKTTKAITLPAYAGSFNPNYMVSPASDQEAEE